MDKNLTDFVSGDTKAQESGHSMSLGRVYSVSWAGSPD